MPAPRGKKRKSEAQSTGPVDDHENAPGLPTQTMPTRSGDETTESPRKRRKVGLAPHVKTALVNNLQIEIAARARKLRAQYNEHIRLMRCNIEMRINRIPSKLRKVKMGDLLAKQQQQQQTAGTTTQKTMVPSTDVFRPPAVPQKDYPVAPRPPLQKATSSNASMAPPPSRGQHNNIAGGDKENEVTQIDMTKKPTRAAGPSVASRAVNPSQVLSPTSSNSRMRPPTERVASPTKSFIARPVSPTKPSVLSNMAEKVRSTRAAATTRKTTTMSSVSTTSSSAPPPPPAKATRGRKPAAATATATASRAGAASRATRRVSAISESSDGSTGTVVRKRTTTVAAKPDPPAKRTVMSTIRKGVTSATTKRAAAAKAAPAAAAATGTGRVLRKRGP